MCCASLHLKQGHKYPEFLCRHKSFCNKVIGPTKSYNNFLIILYGRVPDIFDWHILGSVLQRVVEVITSGHARMISRISDDDLNAMWNTSRAFNPLKTSPEYTQAGVNGKYVIVKSNCLQRIIHVPVHVSGVCLYYANTESCFGGKWICHRARERICLHIYSHAQNFKKTYSV